MPFDSEYPQHAHAWYHFRPYEQRRLQANNVVLRQIVGVPLYIYAETLPELGVPKRIWSGNDEIAFFKDVGYRVQKIPLIVNSNGDLEFEFYCL